MSYAEALDYQLTRYQVEKELIRHNNCIEEFYREIGYKETFSGSELLAYLGY